MYERFEQLLHAHFLSIRDITDELEISSVILTDWKNHRKEPSPDIYRKIADYFGVSFDWLTGKSNSMDNTTELDFIAEFIHNNDFDDEICRDQHRSLWTAYCIHNGYECDTYSYDSRLTQIWEELSGWKAITWCPEAIGFNGFDLFMGELLC